MQRSGIESSGMAGRISLWGSAIAGLLGIVLAINATLAGDYVGAGACLVAAALAFGSIGLAQRVG